MNHLTLIKDVKTSRVSQYLRKTLAKKRLSVEKDGGVGEDIASEPVIKSSDKVIYIGPFSSASMHVWLLVTLVFLCCYISVSVLLH